jgi:hypothetical protein
MSTPGDAPKSFVVELNVVEKDGRVVAAYQAGREAEDAFDTPMRSLSDVPIPGVDRCSESLHRIRLLLGMLFTEALAASLQWVYWRCRARSICSMVSCSSTWPQSLVR